MQRIAMKAPGSGFYMGTMEMDYSYDRNAQETGDAYVRLLEDSLAGDPTLFTVRMPWKRAGRILTRFWITGRNIRRPLFMVIPPEHGDRKRRTCS